MRWLAALLLAVPLTGCAASAADDGRLQVTAGFYPLVWVSERVGGEHVDVTGLTDPGVEPHDIEPTFARTVALARADLVVVEDGLQPAIDEAVAQNAEGRVLDVTDVVGLRERGRQGRSALLARPAAARRRRRRGGRGPGRARPTERRVVRRERHRPARRPRRTSTPSSSPAWPTASDTWSCRATTRSGTGRRYGIEVAPVAGLTPDAEPTPAGLARLQQLIREEGITTVFSERLASPKLDRGARPRPRPAHGRPRPDRGARERRRCTSGGRLPLAHASQPHRPRGGQRMSADPTPDRSS